MTGENVESRSIEGIVFNAILLAFTVVLLAATTGLHSSSRTVPLAVGAPLAVLLAYRLIREAMAARGGRGAVSEGKPVAAAGPATKPRQSRDEAVAILWVLALPAAATVFGFVAGPALFVGAWARFRGGERMAVAVIAGVVAAIVILLLFQGLLRARLPQGVFGLVL